VPIPFINKVPQRTAEQDLEEALHNKNWNPNAALAGKAGKAASSPEPVEPAPAPATALKPVEKQTEKPVEKPADKKPENRAAAASSASAMAAAVADPYVYFVQAGAFVKADDAEQQRAKLAILGFAAKVTEREQSGRTVFRVRLGPMDAREEAEALQRKIESSGNEANLVPVRR
jgi:cell division protein FtsN